MERKSFFRSNEEDVDDNDSDDDFYDNSYHLQHRMTMYLQRVVELACLLFIKLMTQGNFQGKINGNLYYYLHASYFNGGAKRCLWQEAGQEDLP